MVSIHLGFLLQLKEFFLKESINNFFDLQKIFFDLKKIVFWTLIFFFYLKNLFLIKKMFFNLKKDFNLKNFFI